MKIKVAIKQQYGVRTIVPLCESAQLFAEIAGTRTLTKTAIESIKKLGYVIEVEQVVETV